MRRPIASIVCWGGPTRNRAALLTRRATPHTSPEGAAHVHVTAPTHDEAGQGMPLVNNQLLASHWVVSTLGQFCAGVDAADGSSFFGSERVVASLQRKHHAQWPKLVLQGQRGL